MPNVGDSAPDFTAQTDSGETLTLSSLKGKKVVLYFYPKDNTPGCTQEACEFRDNADAFAGRNAVVLGVSTDSVKSHQNFKSKYGLPFPLVADPDKEIVQKYGVWREKKNYGKSYMGVVRSTFLIDEQGKIAKIYDGVRVKGHAEAVLGEV
jgi:peroxiredoxin Q/BCP